jgi:hypothetical protein
LGLKNYEHFRGINFDKINSLKDTVSKVLRRVTPQLANSIGSVIEAVKDQRYDLLMAHGMDVV